MPVDGTLLSFFGFRKSPAYLPIIYFYKHYHKHVLPDPLEDCVKRRRFSDFECDRTSVPSTFINPDGWLPCRKMAAALMHTFHRTAERGTKHIKSVYILYISLHCGGQLLRVMLVMLLMLVMLVMLASDAS